MSHFCVYVCHKSNESVDDLLAPYDENIEMEPYVKYNRQQAIEHVRKYHEDYLNSEIYKEFTSDPEAYKEKYGSNKEHIKYLEEEFPNRLKWTDDECYEYLAEDYREDGMIDEDGNLLSTYNPKSKWDWYEVGGRWCGTLPGNEVKIKDVDIDKIDVPYAFVKPDGEWIERGQMGWWGMSSGDKEEDVWNKEVRDYLKTLPKNTVITAVDCHI